MKIKKLLIANRGEIACRVFRTAKRMGLRTIAVYSEADAQALHVREADEAVRIGPAAARESYLDGAKVLAAAKATGAAVIVAPGGGFLMLSMENEGWDVARALAARGVAAFVLKYRLNQTPADLETFARPAPAGAPPGATPPRRDPAAMMAGLAPQIADAISEHVAMMTRAAKVLALRLCSAPAMR